MKWLTRSGKGKKGLTDEQQAMYEQWLKNCKPKTEKESKLKKFVQRNPIALFELDEFVEKLVTIYREEGDFLPSTSPGGIKAREIGETIIKKYEEYGFESVDAAIQFVASGIYVKLGSSAHGSLDMVWDDILLCFNRNKQRI